MKVYLQWKDPDFVDATTGEFPPDELYDQLNALGAREYLQVEFDLETGTSRVLKPGERIPKSGRS